MAWLMLLTLLIVFMFGALALDVGLWAFEHRTAQTQAEMAAHAGAVHLLSAKNDFAGAKTRVQEWITNNNGNPATDLYACPDPIATITNTTPVGGTDLGGRAVRVCVRRPAISIFGALAGINVVMVSAPATARVIATPSEYALMAFRPNAPCSQPSLRVNGGGSGGSVELGAGYTYVHATCTNSLDLTGGGQLHTTGEHHIIGTHNPNDGPPNLTGFTYDNYPEFMDDPYGDDAIYTQPVIGTLGTCPVGPWFTNNPPARQIDAMIAVGELEPGCYDDAVSISTPMWLDTGRYIFLRGLSSSGGGQLRSRPGGVQLYFTCRVNGGCPRTGTKQDIGGGPAFLNITSGPNDLEPMSAYHNILFWADRYAGAACRMQFSGNGNSGLEGRLYSYPCDVSFSGVGATAGSNLEVRLSIVADEIDFSGAVTFNIVYDSVPPPPVLSLAITE